MADTKEIERIVETEGEKYLPLVHHTLKQSGFESLFPEERVRELRRSLVARNARLFKEHRLILNECQRAGIETIVLKGTAMDALYYPPGVRAFTDMDVLIHKGDLQRVKNILSGLGYCSKSATFQEDVQDFQNEVNYMKEGRTTVIIEPHWMLAPPFTFYGTIDMDGIWKRSQRVQSADGEMRILSPEDFLLHLCVHLFLHHEKWWLASCCDIVELSRHHKDNLQWETFIERAMEWKISLPVRYSLRKVMELFSPPIPSFVMESLERYEPARQERFFFDLKLSLPDYHFKGIAYASFLPLLAIPTLPMKFRYIFSKIFPSREFMAIRYNMKNKRLLPLAYLSRLRDLILYSIRPIFTLFSRK